jgi:hypothetical protein
VTKWSHVKHQFTPSRKTPFLEDTLPGSPPTILQNSIGYSIALISAIERSQRLPNLDAVIQHYIPALALEAEPHLAVQLVEAAARTRGERPPAHWTGNGAALASAILTALSDRSSGPKPPHVRLIEVLRRQSRLLVLDNFEQLLAPALDGSAVTLVAELLAACPGVAVLVTSRERLHLRAEQRYRVPPLAPDDALALFAERAAAVNPAFTITGANHPTVETVCRRLDRLPLAIELCAAQSDMLAPEQLLAQLQERPLDLLVDGAHDLPPRQRPLRTAIEHSYHLLPEEQRKLWRALGIFAGSFDLEAAARVADASASALRALAGKSLVHVETVDGAAD